MALIGATWLHVVSWAVALAATGGPAPVPPVAAQTSTAPEYQVKAVFLFNFAQFVEWPSSAFLDPAAPLTICVLGEDPFGQYLDETVRGESVQSHPLAVRRYDRVEETGACHIVFVGRQDQEPLQAILDTLKRRPILTVSDADEFAERGGMIRFVTDRNRIRLRINLDAARAANLILSSKLLRPAQIVSSDKN